MKNVVIESVEIVWCPNDDRYVVIFKQNDEIIGLNYMQGDSLVDFRKHYCVIDEELTDFYNAIEPYLHHPQSEICKINAAIWAHHEYTNLRDSKLFKTK